jgi:hypothetical protein
LSKKPLLVEQHSGTPCWPLGQLRLRTAVGQARVRISGRGADSKLAMRMDYQRQIIILDAGPSLGDEIVTHRTHYRDPRLQARRGTRVVRCARTPSNDSGLDNMTQYFVAQIQLGEPSMDVVSRNHLECRIEHRLLPPLQTRTRGVTARVGHTTSGIYPSHEGQKQEEIDPVDLSGGRQRGTALSWHSIFIVYRH